MNATLNKIIVVMGLFCVMLGYQNLGRVQAKDLLGPAPVEFESSHASCLLKPLISQSTKDQRTWLKADWGGDSCAKPSFVGWSVYDSEGEFVASLENGLLLGHKFNSPGKYTVILSYTGLQGSGDILRDGPSVLDQIELDIQIQ